LYGSHTGKILSPFRRLLAEAGRHVATASTGEGVPSRIANFPMINGVSSVPVTERSNDLQHEKRVMRVFKAVNKAMLTDSQFGEIHYKRL
jgi:hypothetical protein